MMVLILSFYQGHKIDLYIPQLITLGKQLLTFTCIPSLDSGREYLSSFMRLTIYRNNLNTLTIGWAQLINVLKLKVNRVDYTGWVEQTCGVLVLGNIVVIVRCDGVVSHPVMDWELIHHLHPSKVNLYSRVGNKGGDIVILSKVIRLVMQCTCTNRNNLMHL